MRNRWLRLVVEWWLQLWRSALECGDSAMRERAAEAKAVAEVAAEAAEVEAEAAEATAVALEMEVQRESPQLVAMLPLSKVLREPYRHNAVCRQHLVHLTQKVIRSYVNSFERKAFYTCGSSGCNHDTDEMLYHCGCGIQDPQGVLLASILLLRLAYPLQWASSSRSYANEDRVLCVAVIMVAFKMVTQLAAPTHAEASTKVGRVLSEVVGQAFPLGSGCSLNAVRRMEGRLLCGKIPLYRICVCHPIAVAESELERLLSEGAIVSRSQQAALRGMLSFLVLSSLLNEDEDVLEEMGLWATDEVIGKGLVSAAMSSYGAATSTAYVYPHDRWVREAAQIFVRHALKGPAGYLRVGPYAASGDGWFDGFSSVTVRAAVSRRSLGYAREVQLRCAEKRESEV